MALIHEITGEKCGVFGTYNEGYEAAKVVHLGLGDLQHRGQQGAGMATSDGKEIHSEKREGLVYQGFKTEADIKNLKGYIGIGHVRYPTSGGADFNHLQPVVVNLKNGDKLAVAHNGNFPSVTKPQKFLEKIKEYIPGSNDSEMATHIMAHFLNQGASLEDSIRETYPYMTGVFSMLAMTKDKLAAFRDAKGIRPLSAARLNGGWVFSSETCAFDRMFAQNDFDIEPGQMMVASKNGLDKHQIVPGDLKLDLFEFIYFARPDSRLLGESVYQARKKMGQILAQENPAKVDLVVPVLNSGGPAANGFARELKTPLEAVLVKNPYVGRTFIEPEQHLREKGVDLKHSVVKEAVAGLRICVVDDSIVRSTTIQRIVRMFKRAGAKEVHVRVTAPPLLYPNFYGMDTATQKELIAANLTHDQITEKIGADSLAFLSLEGTARATNHPLTKFNTSNFTGNYDVDIGERESEIRRLVYAYS